MLASEKTRRCYQQILAEYANNLEKSINDSNILKKQESRYYEFKDAWTEVQRRHDKYMKQVTEQSNEEEEWINSLYK